MSSSLLLGLMNAYIYVLLMQGEFVSLTTEEYYQIRLETACSYGFGYCEYQLYIQFYGDSLVVMDIVPSCVGLHLFLFHSSCITGVPLPSVNSS